MKVGLIALPFSDLGLAGGQVTHYIPKLLHGNQLPPPGSGYAAHYNDCGKPNVCDVRFV